MADKYKIDSVMTDDSSGYEFGLVTRTNIRSGHSKVSDWAIIYKTVKDRAFCANKILGGGSYATKTRNYSQSSSRRFVLYFILKLFLRVFC